jgi:hypothetical protein
LVGVNVVFNGLTFMLGPAGRWLRSPAGKSFLGWTGIGLLVIALVWGLLDWINCNW